MSKILINLKSIIEDAFSINNNLLDDSSINLEPHVGINFVTDINNNLFTAVAQIALLTPDSSIGVALRFRYVLEISNLKDLEHTFDEETGIANFNFPKGFIKSVITDVYASGRVLLANHLNGTRYEYSYLPFNGAESLLLNK